MGKLFKRLKGGKRKKGEKSGEGFQNWGGKDFKLGWGIYTPDGIGYRYGLSHELISKLRSTSENV